METGPFLLEFRRVFRQVPEMQQGRPSSSELELPCMEDAYRKVIRRGNLAAESLDRRLQAPKPNIRLVDGEDANDGASCPPLCWQLEHTWGLRHALGAIIRY